MKYVFVCHQGSWLVRHLPGPLTGGLLCQLAKKIKDLADDSGLCGTYLAHSQ
jgi:hypothetical protein